ncbi:MAG: wax ester/triacylglycerol synthase family O-acyltransferase [Nocardioides sp.]|nr:wax ester/triacylglycerol synthase family O-acyltransferase [Nocardioides sp.]
MLAPNDSAWLFAESYRTPMQVGLLATFRVPADRPDFVSDLVARWREHRVFSPPFSYLFKPRPAPSWQELSDDQIDLDYHLRHSALPGDGSQRELGVLVSRLHGSMMDRRYPLWECHVIEGLEKDRWSIYLKMHHSQVDGVGGIRMLRRIFSADPAARDLAPPWAVGISGPDQSGLAPPAPKAVEARSGGLVDGVLGLARDTVTVAGSLVRTYAESLAGMSEDDQAAPFRAPKTIFNGRIHTPRRFATQSYPVDRLKAVATAADGSLNDVFLAICGGAIRTYLIELGKLPSSTLTANVPVSVRQDHSSGHGARVGNAITFLYASLGTDIDDSADRIRAIRDSTKMGKARLPDVSGAPMEAYTAVLMLPFIAQAVLGVGGRGNPASNLVISNVPGPSEARYVDGSRMEEIHPVSLLFNGQALNITAVSYDGQFNIGYTGCRDSVPSLQKIAVYSGLELEKLEAAFGITEKKSGRGTSRAARRTRGSVT